jgi:GNAT superfamily N-acetyltransferase
MHIQEIVTIPSREDEIARYRSEFDVDDPGIRAFAGVIFKETSLNDEHHLGLFADDELVAYLRLDIRDLGLWQITYSLTAPDYRGQGCFRYLLEKAVAEHKKILSDNNQTVEAKNAWESLIKHPGGLMTISAFDIDTNTVSDIQSNDAVWNQQQSPLLLASAIHYSNKIKEHLDYSEKIKKKIGRDRINIWFGSNCCDSKNTL